METQSPSSHNMGRDGRRSVRASSLNHRPLVLVCHSFLGQGGWKLSRIARAMLVRPECQSRVVLYHGEVCPRACFPCQVWRWWGELLTESNCFSIRPTPCGLSA